MSRTGEIKTAIRQFERVYARTDNREAYVQAVTAAGMDEEGAEALYNAFEDDRPEQAEQVVSAHALSTAGEILDGAEGGLKALRAAFEASVAELPVMAEEARIAAEMGGRSYADRVKYSG